jgi:hypothetical protein
MYPSSSSASGYDGSTSCPSPASSRAAAWAPATHSGCASNWPPGGRVIRPMRSRPGSAPTSSVYGRALSGA